jgi:ribonuclease HI
MNNGFKDVKNVDMIKHLLVLLRRRSASNKVVFKYVAGHTGEIGNEAADVSQPVSAVCHWADNQALARRGALSDALPDRENWLNPDDVDESEVPETSEVVVEVSFPVSSLDSELTTQVDESWLLSAEDLAELEKDFMWGLNKEMSVSPCLYHHVTTKSKRQWHAYNNIRDDTAYTQKPHSGLELAYWVPKTRISF